MDGNLIGSPNVDNDFITCSQAIVGRSRKIVTWLKSEVVAVEYYSNQSEDDIEAGIVGGLIEEEKDPNGEETMEIIGDTFIKVKNNYDFYFDGTYAADWRVDSQYPVVLKPDTKDPRKVTLYWDNPYSGQFTLEYGKYSKIIDSRLLRYTY